MVFKDFVHLFKAKESLEKMIEEGGVNQKSLLDLYNYYVKMEREVVYKVPKFIHMNLIKIDC